MYSQFDPFAARSLRAGYLTRKEASTSHTHLSTVLLSLVGIATVLVVVFGLITAKQLDDWTPAFFLTTVATSLTGFLFPFHNLLPSHVIGIISLVTLAIALLARYLRHLT